ncbi:protein mono-ADP-ribosyltransferase PARP9 isoform X3 [Melanotaenia boesemani]|uniref:protein mono-ADP-ribosyltransferase PARP9 isoform X3 n=1 Tax=Melanotaenia boesemani TaxID=1250792 RepID=UPI001C0475B2|nr:protein mono-ADP-ribosyltransferase PARP9 isoform X3 [Melanotaenia boesemani]
MAGNEAVIPLHGASLAIVKDCGRTLSDIFSSKFGCAATFDGVDLEEGARFSQHRGPAGAPEKRFVATLQAGVQVSVWKGDLTCFTAEAVVNAANTGLQHIGGLAYALSKAGGPQIQRDSNVHVSRHGDVKKGDAIISDAGLLKYKKIIHAVGPDLQYNPSEEDVSRAEPLLQKVIWEILHRVKEYRLKSVAIPAISSGLFNYPLPKCAEIIVLSIKDYYEHSPPQGHRPNEIFLVNHDEPTVKEIERACHKILAPQHPMSYSQATASNTRAATRASATTVTFGNVRVTLMKGKIEEQNMHVIVNTASLCGDLSKGAISRAILTRAGYKMQKDMDKANLTGHIKVTGPYELSCKEVYHTFCVQKGGRNASQILVDSVADCLYRASKSGYKSIAFPAIGTGNLNFRKDEVASMMFNAVADFSSKNPAKMEVYFVIFPSDDDTFEAFEEQMRSVKQSSSHPSFAPATENRENVHSSRTPSPQITLTGPSEEAVAEARTWYHDLISQHRPVNICNNFILHFGEKEHRQLSGLMKRGVSVEEFFTQGHACIMVQGDKEETIPAVLQVEAMLCKIQQEFVSEEEREISMLSSQEVSWERKTVPKSSKDFKDQCRPFKKHLWVSKVDRVENRALKMLFDLKKQQLKCSTSQKMFQLIPAQFCEMISCIGFHAECAPPEDPKYGEGIYFASTVEAAMGLWKQKNEEFLYFVAAEVLTGNSAPGKPGFILPPPVGSDPLCIYDSVGGPDVSVIFSSYQALPKYIITCKKQLSGSAQVHHHV